MQIYQYGIVAKVAIDFESNHLAAGFVGQLVQTGLAVQVLIGQAGVHVVTEPDDVELE